jgi:lipoprotein-anchoring transpeptidase ErfK/SrfK
MKFPIKAICAVLFGAVFITGCTEMSGSDSTPLNAYSSIKDGEYKIPAIPRGKLKSKWKRKRVAYNTKYRPGTIVVNTKEKYLYLVEKGGTAMRYGVGVGKQGFAWSGNAQVGWKRPWPTWTPPRAMIKRKPKLKKYAGGMPPGLDNPLGARAMYLMKGGRDTLYRIHGSPEWWSIGTNASSGCIRLMNHDIIDLYNRVNPGAKVVVRHS